MGKSQTKAKNKYNEKAYDRIPLVVKKGVKDIWKSEAERQGLSLNGFICNAVSQYIEQHENMSKLLSVALEELDLSLGSFRCLKRACIQTIGDLKQFIDENQTLYAVRNLDNKRITEIIDVLRNLEKDYGVSLNIDYNSLNAPKTIKIFD